LSKRISRWHIFRHTSAPYLFIAPFIIMFAIFYLYPLIKSLILAFYITVGPKSKIFVGFDNFRFMFHDPDFYRAVRNTVLYALGSVFVQLPVSLGLAILLNRSKYPGRNFFRFSFFSPYMFGSVFVAVLFGVLFVPHFGLVNKLVAFFYSVDIKWLSNPKLVLPALILTALWLYAGLNMIYFLAALQSVPKELYEAARVDGANALHQFLHVTWPGIKPVAVFVIMMSTIGSFQLFELAWVMLDSSPGPDNAGLTIIMYLYQSGFVSGDLGYASAIGWVLTCGLGIISFFQMKVTGALSK